MRIKSFQLTRIVQLSFIILFIMALYFLLPFILKIFGVPAYVITTGSMVHYSENQAFFESFWDDKGVKLSELPVKHGLNPGDLIIQESSQNYSMGDVITFKTSAKNIRQTHRLYEYNLTNFRDIQDPCIAGGKYLETVWLAVKGDIIIKIPDPNPIVKYERIYQGPAYETCTHNWLPASNIEGKVIFVLPKAGLLYQLIYPYHPE